MRRVLATIAVLAATAAGAGCGEKDEPVVPDAASAGELTVMSFNVWYGGASVDPGQITAAIRAADADIVGVQEPEGNLRRIGEAAGLPFVEESLHLISRYPLYPAERDGVAFAYAEVAPDRVVAVANAHLTCCPYGPNLVRAGKSAAEVEAVERRLRLPEVEPYAELLSGLADEGVPGFLTGDMNSPSHLDWTAEAVEARDLPYALEWPASKALADAGIDDSYREAHPDPAAEPGLTWTPGTPPPYVRADETTDRIDWVLSSGPATTFDSRLVGEEGGPDVEIGVTPWGSDHRAVASSFDIDPADAPDLVDADPRVVERGSRVTLRYALGGTGAGREVGVLPAGAMSGKDALESVPIFDGADHVAPMLGTASLPAGPYRAALYSADGSILATSPFWVQEPAAEPAIETTRPAFRAGRPIGVRWRDGTANKLDYVGIFRAGEPSLYDYLGFLYTGARPSGSLEFARSDTGRLAPGHYVANLMLDDGYTIVASAPFTVER